MRQFVLLKKDSATMLVVIKGLQKTVVDIPTMMSDFLNQDFFLMQINTQLTGSLIDFYKKVILRYNSISKDEINRPEELLFQIAEADVETYLFFLVIDIQIGLLNGDVRESEIKIKLKEIGNERVRLMKYFVYSYDIDH